MKYIENLLRDAVRHNLAVWRAVRQIETELKCDIDDIQTMVDEFCINVDDGVQFDVSPLLDRVLSSTRTT